jgi:hypothetical protein
VLIYFYLYLEGDYLELNSIENRIFRVFTVELIPSLTYKLRAIPSWLSFACFLQERQP